MLKIATQMWWYVRHTYLNNSKHLIFVYYKPWLTWKHGNWTWFSEKHDKRTGSQINNYKVKYVKQTCKTCVIVQISKAKSKSSALNAYMKHRAIEQHHETTILTVINNLKPDNNTRPFKPDRKQLKLLQCDPVVERGDMCWTVFSVKNGNNNNCSNVHSSQCFPWQSVQTFAAQYLCLDRILALEL